jgi:protein-S-isoprenylcysteine O-methyltransferase Ste14
VYGGIGIAVRSPSILILMRLLAIATRHGVVAREKTDLERRVGDTYRDDTTRVSAECSRRAGALTRCVWRPK